MEPEQVLHSFPYEASIGGREHYYRITQNEQKYGIEQDGVVIAEVAFDEHWMQIYGKPLSKELLNNIYDHIEAHFC